MTKSLKIQRLVSRPQFLAAAKGVSQARGAVVVQRLDRRDGDPVIRVGFTATRKVGGAVVRNRAKRRLREAARVLAPTYGAPGSDYVLIARMGTVGREWDRLLDDVKSALTRLATSQAASAPPVSPRPVSPRPVSPGPVSPGPASSGAGSSELASKGDAAPVSTRAVSGQDR